MRKLENFLKVVVSTFSKSTVKSEFVRVPTFYTGKMGYLKRISYTELTLNNYRSL